MKPKITLKNIKHAEFASEETYCFEATVYVNGNRLCYVKNDGHGGPDFFWPLVRDTGKHMELDDRITAINAELGKEQIDIDGTGKYMIENSLELEIAERMTEWLVLKDAKKLLKKVAYLGDDGEIYTLKSKYKPTPETIEGLKKASWWKDSYQVLNEQPIEKVVEALKR